MFDPDQMSDQLASTGDGKAILLIEDDIKYSRLISKYLSEHGYNVTAMHDGKSGLDSALSGHFDAIILDIKLPGKDGYHVLQSIRKRSSVPVLMLSALGEETDRIVGLELGADDYLPKSFSPREILARLRAVLRRLQRVPSPSGGAPHDTVIGSLVIQPDSRKVLLNGQSIDLTAIEFDLLLSLARSKGRIKTREQLLNDIKNFTADSCDRSVDVHVSMLRRKLNDDARNPRLIRTVRSIGYLLVDPDEPID